MTLQIKNEHCLPNIKDIVQNPCGSKWFTVLDLKDDLNIKINEDDKHNTAFEQK